MRLPCFVSTAAITVASTFLLTLFNGTRVNVQACTAGSAQEINGNWYCSEVNAISYTNFPGYGYYDRVTDMDESTGQCTSVRYSYSGSLSPLNEEVGLSNWCLLGGRALITRDVKLSLHVRGPTWLKQVAVYTLDISSGKKRDIKRSTHDRRHGGHQYLHKRRGKVEEVYEHGHEHGNAKRSVDALVSATIDGQLVPWTNTYAGPGIATGVSSPMGAEFDEVNNDSLPDATRDEYAPIVTNPTTLTSPSWTASNATASSEIASAVPASNSMSSASVTSGSWALQAYYSADNGTVQGITFLNHFGGMDGIPGTSAGGPAFGNSLSYSSPDGQSGAASAQTLSNALIEDDVEVIIMSDKSCDDGGCGYTRPGGVSYHGFSGSQKVFLLEFSMPTTNETGFNADMPAIWLMNAQIPLTSQYGENPDCSCWTSGCGEFDIFEILDSGNFRCKSTLHMAPAGGSSDWFQRPSVDSIKAAVVISGDNEVATIRILDQDQAFDESLETNLVRGWVEEPGSTFDMAG